ncbi:hypothetical protein N8009_01810 [Flavobacteriaceae bacterium]|nr:hypothetical protein [Flavobacteriaceae bacterium]
MSVLKTLNASIDSEMLPQNQLEKDASIVFQSQEIISVISTSLNKPTKLYAI